ncbi:glycosyl transferase [Christiangramia forsetii]|uniref:Glycosyl transferase n=1 Tax=Christiangramia forsetii TaxID=411153 RepID=A0ABQ1WW20_9FLAO|nr:glycosyltransferase family 4 protein [Christiangramia forsetii]GGG44721.1 glycosyl transferase [Christiangramia forsetii]
MQKLVRITTIPLSLEKLLEGQLTFMNQHYEVIAVSADRRRLEKYGVNNKVRTFWVEMTRAITPLQDIQSLWRLYRFFKKEKPLIVHTHTPKAGILGMLAGTLARVPIRLHTVAGLPLMETTGIKRQVLDHVETLTYKFATRVYPNSFELEKIILKLGYAKKNKLKVLGRGSSNGIDSTYFDPADFSSSSKIKLRKELDILELDFIFIFVGRLVKEKGINELINCFVRLHKIKPEISLLLVGPFEQDLDPVDNKVYDLMHSHPKIFLTGYKQDVRPYFAIADVLAFPSYREGFPNVVMQANAMGLPAIVTNINGCNEIITEGENGLIIPVKEENKLYAAMLKMLSDSSLREMLAQKARKLIQMDFERVQFWQILLKEYKELEDLNKHD